MRIRLVLAKFQCKKCGEWFDDFCVATDYGELLVRSIEKHELALLQVDSPGVIAVRDCEAVLGWKPRPESAVDDGRATLEAVADSASDGSRFRITDEPPCPRCGWQGLRTWRFCDPPHLTEADVQLVKFGRFLGLERACQIAEIRKVIERLLRNR